MKFYDNEGVARDSVAEKIGADIGIGIKKIVNKIRGKDDPTLDDFIEDEFELWDEEVAGEPEPQPEEEKKMHKCKCGNLETEKPGEKCAICATVTE